jgi:hypothetical protein
MATSRWSLAAIIAGGTFITVAPAQPASATSIGGVYNGSYAGGQDALVRGQVASAGVTPVKFKLSITQQDNGMLTGVFAMYLREGSDTKAYTCAIVGNVHANRTFQLRRSRWETVPPSNVSIMGMSGTFDPDGGQGAGEILGKMLGRPGSDYEAVRDPAESATLASVTAATKDAGAPGTPVAQPGRWPTAAKPATPSPASPAPVLGFTWRTAIWNGVYTGTFGTNADDNVTAKLYVKFIADGSVLGTFTGLFTFDVPPSLGAKLITYTYKLIGRPNGRMAEFYSAKPLGSPAPEAYAVTQLGVNFPTIFFKGSNGQLESTNNPDQISGRVSGSNGLPSNNFVAVRDKAESANVDSLMAAQASAASVVSTTAPAQPPNSPPSSAPSADIGNPKVAISAERVSTPITSVGPTAINGVYTGRYNRNGSVPMTLQFSVKSTDDGSVTGLFTYELPAYFRSSVTYKLTGRYVAGTRNYPFQFTTVELLGSATPDASASLVKAVNASIAGLGSIFGTLTGTAPGAGLTDMGNFDARRDPTESANLDSVMAAQTSAASIASTAAPVVRVGTLPQGVFNGTFTRENEPPTRFKLTITRTNDNLGGMAAGIATIYLPTDSGTKAYTYSLIGHYSERDFDMSVQDWVTIPPKDFKNFKGMGFNGEFRSNVNQNTARIISVKQASRSDITFFVPTFEAVWDPTESTDIKGTLAAQMAVGDADQIAALEAHAEVVKNAKPKQLASKYLVRKSQAYWDGYRSDFIREVFDGGFADDVDSDPAFQSLFVDYVDLFSNTCAAYLPADHQTITIVTTTTTTYPGGATTTSTMSKTVEIDSRFIDQYAEYSGVDPEAGSDQEKEQTAKTTAIVGYIFHRGGPSHGTSPADAIALLHLEAAHGLFGGTGMNKFFATEVKAGVPSAALRQMGENLLRGATGEPSLQEAGAKIDGAEAETDKNLPPGRFAHLIDAAHAFYREPGNARLESRFETAFDETLAVKYRGVMTREEEYYYANDYGNRFRGQIMQPRSYCEDPEWPRLHPAVEECVAEIQ